MKKSKSRNKHNRSTINHNKCKNSSKSSSIGTNIGGYKSTYTSTGKLNLAIETTKLDDQSSASVDEGFNVGVYVSAGTPGKPVEFSGNARYSNNIWYIDSAGPFKVGSHKLRVTLYCAQEACSQKNGPAAISCRSL